MNASELFDKMCKDGTLASFLCRHEIVSNLLVAEVLSFSISDDRDFIKYRANCEKLRDHVLTYIRWEIDHKKVTE